MKRHLKGKKIRKSLPRAAVGRACRKETGNSNTVKPKMRDTEDQHLWNLEKEGLNSANFLLNTSPYSENLCSGGCCGEISSLQSKNLLKRIRSNLNQGGNTSADLAQMTRRLRAVQAFHQKKLLETSSSSNEFSERSSKGEREGIKKKERKELISLAQSLDREELSDHLVVQSNKRIISRPQLRLQ